MSKGRGDPSLDFVGREGFPRQFGSDPLLLHLMLVISICRTTQELHESQESDAHVGLTRLVFVEPVQPKLVSPIWGAGSTRTRWVTVPPFRNGTGRR